MHRPTPETIADGSYPLVPPPVHLREQGQGRRERRRRAYVDYYLAEGTIASVLETVPYVNLTPEALAESRSAWDAAK